MSIRNKTIPQGRPALPDGKQVTKGLIEGDEQSRFAQCFFQNRVIPKARMRLVNPQDIVPPTPQQGDAVSRNVFVSVQAHRVSPLLARSGKDLFLSQKVSCVGEAGVNVFLCKTRIIPRNLFVAPTFGEQIQYKLNRQSSSANDRFARAGRLARIGGRQILRMTCNPTTQTLYDRIAHVLVT